MERFAYILVCIVAIAALAMIMMVIIAVLKVSSEQDGAYDMTERIKFQAREGLRQRDEYTNEVYIERRDAHDERVGREGRHGPGYSPDKSESISLASGKGAHPEAEEENGQRYKGGV